MRIQAREFFLMAREASLDVERTRRQLAEMESREGVKAQSYEPTFSGGAGSDPMRATDARLDREADWHRRIERNYSLIDRACCLIYGAEDESLGIPEHGIEGALGSAVADAMWWRYCAAESWRTTSSRVGYSESWCYQADTAAIAFVDSLGIDLTAWTE